MWLTWLSLSLLHTGYKERPLPKYAPLLHCEFNDKDLYLPLPLGKLIRYSLLS